MNLQQGNATSQSAAPIVAPIVSRIRLIRMPKVCEITSLSRVGVYQAMKRDGFPQPIKLGQGNAKQRRSAWVLSEVEDWLEARTRTSRRQA